MKLGARGGASDNISPGDPMFKYALEFVHKDAPLATGEGVNGKRPGRFVSGAPIHLVPPTSRHSLYFMINGFIAIDQSLASRIRTRTKKKTRIASCQLPGSTLWRRKGTGGNFLCGVGGCTCACTDGLARE